MNPCKKYLVTILDNIQVNGRLVDVLTEFNPGNTLPVVSMTSSGGKGHLETLTQPIRTSLPEDHPCYNPDNPYFLFNTGMCRVEFFESNMVVHVWSETNTERDTIIHQIYRKMSDNMHRQPESLKDVWIKDIGSTTDLDQYGGYPPLYHSTIPIIMRFKLKKKKKINPICHLTHKKKWDMNISMD